MRTELRHPAAERTLWGPLRGYNERRFPHSTSYSQSIPAGSAERDLLMSSSVGKRRREQQKQERAQSKAERKAARRAMSTEEAADPSPRSEMELIEELGVLQRTFETGEISPEDFEERRGRIQVQLERLSQ
jgi:hypothetical protein